LKTTAISIRKKGEERNMPTKQWKLRIFPFKGW
jgi:hypothetical protein